MGSHFETPLLARALGRLSPVDRGEGVTLSHPWGLHFERSRDVYFHPQGDYLHAGADVELKIFRTLSLIIKFATPIT